MKIHPIVLLSVSVLLFVPWCHADDDFDNEPDLSDQDQSDWIDPTDMLNYDLSTQKMKKPQQKHDKVRVAEKKKNVAMIPMNEKEL